MPSVPRLFLRLRQSPWSWRAIAATVVVVVGTFVYIEDDLQKKRGPYALEVGLATERAGSAQVFFDRGQGFRQVDSSSRPIKAVSTPTRHRFPLGLGALGRLRLDPLNGYDGAATVERPEIVDTRTGAVLRSLDLGRARPNDDVASYSASGSVARLAGRPGSSDPQLVFSFDRPLQLGPSPMQRAAAAAPALLAVLLALVAAAWALDQRVRAAAQGGRIATVAGWLRSHPRCCLSLVAIASVAACCHPTLFLGRSLFSADYGLPLLHPEHPRTAAESPAEPPAEDGRGSDTGAMLWQHFPYSIVQHRALFEEGVFPWWNRFNSTGAEHFGQGQSMLGEPLHAAVILAGAAVWAWDAKLIVARVIFAVGAGFAAFAATRRLGPSLVLTAVAPFIGFFTYRLNHPALITVAYAPWLLACWLEVARATSSRATRGWLLALFLANACVLTSGTVKEATMTVLVLNATGGSIAFATARTRGQRWWLALTSVLLLVAGVLVLAPWWLAFLDTLRDSWTAYDEPYAARIPLARWLGLFDGMFSSELMPDRMVYAPSANGVILLGIVLAGLSWRELRSNRVAIACATGAGLSLSLAYDTPWVPSGWVLAVPVLRSVGHVGNTFSCVALPLLFVLAAQGFAAVSGRRPALASRLAVWTAVLTAAFAAYAPLAWAAWTADGETRMVEILGQHGYFLGSALALIAGGGFLLVGASWIRPPQALRPGAGTLLVVAGAVALLARHGQTITPGHAGYFLNPAPRSDLLAPSAALEWTRAHAGEPFRLVGVDGHVFAGFAAVHRIESPNGPDALANRVYRELTEAAGLAPARDWYFPTDPATLTRHRRLLDMLNVRYYATCARSAAAPDWTVPRAALDLSIAESPTAWPRAFFASSVVPYTTVPELLARLECGDGAPFAAMLAAEVPAHPAGPQVAVPRSVVPAQDYAIGTNRTAFTVSAPSAGVAVLMEAWVPDRFVATLDGRPVSLLRVNHAFKGVWIPAAGEYRIAMEYRPRHALARLVLPAIGVLLLAAALAQAPGRRVGRGTPSNASGRILGDGSCSP